MSLLTKANNSSTHKFYNYLASPTELFARSYSQYVATKLNDVGVLRTLKNTSHCYIPDEQFKSVYNAFEEYFKAASLSK